MKKEKYSSGKRLLAWLLVVAVTFGSIPNTVTYYATETDTPGDDSNAEGTDSPSIDNSANNEAVKIQLVDSYDDELITDVKDVSIRYNIVTEEQGKQTTEVELTDKWETLNLKDVNSNEITVLDENVTIVSKENGMVTRLYLQIEKKNYVTYNTVVELKEDSQEAVEIIKISLDKQILIGSLSLTYSENENGEGITKELANTNTKWSDFLSEKSVKYAVKKVETATGTTEGITDWKENLKKFEISQAGKYEVFVKITEKQAGGDTTRTTGNEEWIQSIVVEIKKAKIEHVSIIQKTDLKYNGASQELVTVDGLKAGDKIVWIFNDTQWEEVVVNDGNISIPTGTIPGEYKVGLKVDRGNNYETLVIDPVIVTIAPAEISLEADSIITLYDGYVYDGSEHNAITSVQNHDGYTFSYCLCTCTTDQCEHTETTSWVTDDKDNSLKVKDAGFYTVLIKAEHSYYETEIIEAPFVIAKKEISKGDITVSPKTNLTYDGSEGSLVELIETEISSDAQAFLNDSNSSITWKVEKKNGEAWDVVSSITGKNAPTACYLPGIYRVILTIENKNYKTFTTTEDIVVVKGTFSVSETLTAYSGIYNGNEHPVLSLPEKTRDYSFEYHLCNCSNPQHSEEFLTDTTIEWSKEVPTVKNVGSYKVFVKAVKEHYNNAKVGTYNVEITPESLSDIEIGNPTLVYNATKQNIVTLRGLVTETTLSDTVQFKEEATWTVKFKSLIENSEWETVLDNVVLNTIPQYDLPGTYEVTVTVKGATKEIGSADWNYSNYQAQTKTVTVIIEQGRLDVSGLTVVGYSGIYDGTEHEAAIKKSTTAHEYELYYHLCSKECGVHTEEAIINETSKWGKAIPKVRDAGSYTVWVKAVQEHYYDENVTVEEGEGAVAPYNIYIEKADQSLVFVKEEWNITSSQKVISQKIPFNNVAYVFGAKIGVNSLTTEGISYTVVEKTAENSTTAKASIDAEGNLTVTEPGTYVITAILPEDENCKGSTISHELTVSAKPENAGDFIAFKDGNGSSVESKEYVLKTKNETISTLKAFVLNENDKGIISYTIDKTDVGISCNQTTGEIEVTNYYALAEALIQDVDGCLEITVTANKAKDADSNGKVVFAEDSTSYQLKISFAELPEDFDLDVSKSTGTNGWYNAKDTLTVTVPEVYTAYTVSKTYKKEEFSSSVVFSDEGINERIIYLQNEKGEITAPIKLVDKEGNKLKIDTIAPDTEKMNITFSESNWIQKIGKLFGFDPSVTITFAVKDEIETTESGLASITWTYTREENASDSILETKTEVINVDNMEKDENGYKATVTLSASEAEQYRGHISFTATDKAGNTSNAKTDTDKVIVLDTISPRLQVKYELANEKDKDGKETVHHIVENVNYYSDDVKFTFVVTEANFFAEDINISVSKDDESIELGSEDITWTTDATNKDLHYGIFILSEDGEYVISMKYLNGQDNSKNPMLDATTGGELPVYTSEKIIIDKIAPEIGFSHNETEQTVTFTVTEQNFRPQDISLDLISTIKDVNGKDTAFTVEQLQTKLRDAKWENSSGVWTCTFNYENDKTWSDGIYNLTINYKDIVERTATPLIAPEFIIDHTAPKIEVGYNEPSKKVEDVSYYDGTNPVNVTVTIREQNFTSEDVIVSVIKDGVAVSEINVAWSTDTNDKEKHIGTFTLVEDGHYDIQVAYTDSFGNSMIDYVYAGKIVIDSTIPTIDVQYTQKNDSNYFSKEQTAVITVTERNFNSDNVKVDIKATSHDGTILENTNNKFYQISGWSKGTIENTYILTITYSGDANYCFDISCIDIVGNQAKDYVADYFTVDKSAPDVENLEITYKDTTFIEKLVNGVKQLFGFHDIFVKVTFTAEDKTSGIQAFKWKMAKELDSEWKTVGAKLVSNDSNQYVAEIILPNTQELEQMRDYLQVTAVNKSGLESNVKDEKDRIVVVDTINPILKAEHTLSKATGNVYYEDKDNKVHYYSDDVKFRFTVTEANFFAEDIVISVSKDGKVAETLTSKDVIWTTDEKDETVHYGTFTLSEEGNYVVFMKYLEGESSQDNSKNPMLDATTGGELSVYTSEKIIIDKTAPEIKFSYDKVTQKTTFEVKERNFKPQHIFLNENSSIKDVNGNPIKFTVKELEAILQNATWTQKDTDIWTYSFDYKEDNISLDGIYDLTIEYKDFVERTATNKPNKFIIDRTKSEIVVEYNKPAREFNGVSYYSINDKVESDKKNPLEVTITIKEQNFVSDDVIVSVVRDGKMVPEIDVKWSIGKDASTGKEDKEKHIGTFTLVEDGHYDIQVAYTDSFENVMTSYELVDALVIDSTPSVIDVTYTPGKTVNTLTDSKGNKRKYFSEKQTIAITVTERNFNKDEVKVNLVANAHDLNGTALDNTNNQVYEVLGWSQGEKENTHILKIVCYANANYSLDIAYKDLATNETLKKDYFTVDTVSPIFENLEITYPETNFVEKFINGVKELFGFHGSDDTTVTVVFTADDETAGIKSFKWKTDMESDEEWKVVEAVVDSQNSNQYTAEITLPNADEVEQLRAHLQVVAIDKSGNESVIKDEVGRNIVVDTITPTLKVHHMSNEEDVNYNLVEDVHYYSGDVAFTFIIEETNFFPEDVNIFVSKDGGNAEILMDENITWMDYGENKDIHYGTFILSGDGDYVVSMNYMDNSGNIMTDAQTGDDVIRYQSDVITIDTIDPEVEFSYDRGTQSTTFTVTEHNFRPEDIRIDATKDGEKARSVIADINGTATDFTVEELEAVLQKAEWVQGKEDSDVWKYTFNYEENGTSLDGIYDLKLDYTDLAKRDAVSCEPETFIIDRTAAKDVSITYQTPLSLFEEILEKILEKITLGFYNPNPTVTVTFTAYDGYSGVESFSWDYTQRDGTSTVNRPTDKTETVVKAVQDKTDKSKYTASIVLSDREANELKQLEQMHGYLSVFTTDKYENRSNKVTDDGRVFVVDTISPTMKVEYSLENNSIETDTGKNSYYQGDATVTFYVNEANFYAEDVKVLVSKDGNEAQRVSPTWTNVNVDEHIGTYTLSGDGDYIVYVMYDDYSGNVMIDAETGEKIEKYQSHIITIDTIDPEVEFSYDRGTQSTTFTVTEHNFRPEDIRIDATKDGEKARSVIADINGKATDFTVEELEAVLQKAKWVQEKEDSDVWTYTFNYKENGTSLDGIYDLKLDYTDLAKREAISCKTKEFIIDRTAAKDVSIAYQTPLIEKILEKITLGFYNPTVTVTFTAYDNYSGVESFSWNYTQRDGTSTVNRPTDKIETVVKAVQDKTDKSKYTASIVLSDKEANELRQVEQMDGYLSVFTTDKYENRSNKVTDDGRVFVVDTISPTMKVEYSLENNSIETDTGKNSYYQGDATVTFYVNEANFYAEDVKVLVSKDGNEAQRVSPTWTNVNVDEHIGTYTFSGDGDYIVYVMYDDYSGNVMTDAETGEKVVKYQSHIITIDTIDPEVEFSYDRDTQSTTFTVTEHNFRPEDIRIDATKDGEKARSVIADINGKATDFTVEELEAVLQKAKWVQGKEDTDVWTYTFNYKENGTSLDGIYDLKLDYTDLAKRDAVSCEPEEFIIDRTAAKDVSIAYQTPLIEKILEKITLGFYNPTVTVTFTAYDNYSGVESFSWDYTQRDGTSTINRPTDKTETVVKAVQDKTDKSKHTASIVLSDREAKELRQLEQMHGYLSVFTTDKYENESDKVTDDGRVFVVDTISPTMKVEYSPQNTKSNDGSIFYYQENTQITFYVNEANFYEENVNVTLSKDGAKAVPITVTWTDVSVDKHIGTYTISGDGDYVLYVTYSDYSQNVMVDEETKEQIINYQSHIITIDTIDPVLNFTFNESKQETTFIVNEHNFQPKNMVVTGTRKDLNGNDIYLEEVGLSKLLQNAEWKQEGDTYTYTFDYKKNNVSLDGIYNFTLECIDLSGRVAQPHQTGAFTIDRTAPSNVEFSYSKSILDTILEIVTLGFYNPSVRVTLTSYDKYIGVDYFEWRYVRQNDVSNINRITDTKVTRIKAVQDNHDKSKFTATFDLPNTAEKQLRGYLAATATDNYNNVSQNVNDAGYVVVVDTIAPTITAEYSEADRIVGSTGYYNNDVDITFTVNEANFFREDVKVSVSKDGGRPYTLKTNWSDVTTDVHVGTCRLSGDGDYVITVNYIDRSSNQMKTYTSHVLTIDTIAPVIDVTYQNTNVINTLTDSEEHEREYFSDTQTAVVTITEHNFNSQEVDFSIVAKDVTGAELNIDALHTKAAWKDGTEEDTHVMVITYPGDANYIFDVAYTDLATNAAIDYTPDYFTVDNTTPVNLKTEYSTSLLETILETITFGFYNAKVNVTLTAEDDTSGVHEFKYSYRNAEGVSGVNAELIDQMIAASEIEYSNSGKNAKVEFSIPKDVLTNVSQFNGTISFEATDRAGVKNTLDDNRRVVVDNIAPTAQVTYNEPINMEGTVSYYDADVQATIVINEANFYPEDVIVTVSKDGDTSYPVTPLWSNNSVDVHTGTFTLTGDGDYFITISYTDKSSNEMMVYTSEQLTIDTEIEAPVILFNGNNENAQAYKGEVIPSISFTDVNFDSFEVHLYRTYKGARDVEITEEKELNGFFNISEQAGDATLNIFATGEDGKYNPDDDGIYHLVITMKDKSGHTVDSEAYFTINRYGSVYEYSEYLSWLIADGGAYVKEVAEDLVIMEYNADRLVSESLDIEITRDGKPLENVEYSVSPAINEHVTVGESGWFQYEYIISKNNFLEDGIYKISISSKDATGNAPENNNFEDKNIRFYVDSTVPEITSITGLEKNVVNNTQLTIRYMVFDVVGLKSVKIYVDGEILEEVTEFGEEFNHYEGNFTLTESENRRSVRIVIEDLAGNITDTDSKEFSSAYVFNKEVVVTTNAVVRFLANEELVNGVLVGVAAVTSAVGVGMFLKRRKVLKGNKEE